jgi:hypothetical protein
MTVNGAASRPRDESDAALPAPQRYILVGESKDHLWVVKDNTARLGAVFLSPDVAMRFARREARSLGCHVVVDGGLLELDCLSSVAPAAPRTGRARRWRLWPR